MESLARRKTSPAFSEIYPQAAYSFELKERKARTILAVLKDFHKADLGQLSILDLGSSTGVIAQNLASYFARVVGIDIDRAAVNFAKYNFKKANLDFALVDGINLAFRNNMFDIVICNHIYEHVHDAGRLLHEVNRVLRPGGICYFTADNRLRIREPHYGLPFLSLLPRSVSGFYLRASGRGSTYQEKLLSHNGLRDLVREFTIIDYTSKIIRDPSRFGADYMLLEGSFKHRFANLVVRNAFWLCPGYIWLLQKGREYRSTQVQI